MLLADGIIFAEFVALHDLLHGKTRNVATALQRQGTEKEQYARVSVQQFWSTFTGLP